MKILSLNVYTDTSVGGGAERINDMLMRTLQAQGHEVVNLGTAAKSGLTHTIENGISTWQAGIRNLYWPRSDQDQSGWKRKAWHLLDVYNLRMRHHLQQVLDHEKPDVVIMHNLVGWSISAIDAIHAQKIAMIQVLHDHYNICPNSQMFKNNRNCVQQCRECRLLRMPHRSLTNKVDAVIGVSRYILDRHAQHDAYESVPIKKVIHNVVSAEALGLATAEALRLKTWTERGDVNVRFGFMGTISSYKGIEYLLDAFVALNQPKSELWIAGTGKPEYIAMLKQRFSMPQIKFLGRISPKNFFTAIDVTIVPSLWQENFPGVVTESLAFGVPVIGSRRGGIPEMLVDQVSGLLFEPDHSEELGRSLKYFIDQPDEIKRMSRNALIASKPLLDIENWTKSYELIIDDARKLRTGHVAS